VFKGNEKYLDNMMIYGINLAELRKIGGIAKRGAFNLITINISISPILVFSNL